MELLRLEISTCYQMAHEVAKLSDLHGAEDGKTRQQSQNVWVVWSGRKRRGQSQPQTICWHWRAGHIFNSNKDIENI